MNREIFAVVNPCAASRKAARHWKSIQESMIRRGVGVTARYTEGRFHAAALAREAVRSGARLIIGVGGDGTFNEIVNGYMTSGVGVDHLPEFGMIAVGTGSDFTRMFKIPSDPDRVVDVMLHGTTRTLDIGKVVFSDGRREWTRYFANVFDVGLGGTVVRFANRMPKSLGGFLTFLFSSLAGIVLFKPQHLRFEADGGPADSGVMNIVGVANGRYFGGGMDIAPMTRPDDGVFELLYVKDTNVFKFIWRVLLPVYEAGHLAYERLYHYPVRMIRIRGDRMFLADIDGEEEKALSAEVSIVPETLKVRVQR